MEKHAPSWNGIGYVQVEYEGGTYMSNSITEANFIYKYMHQDKPGSQIVLQFRYEDDLEDFFQTLNNKTFKQIPSSLCKRETNTELYGENIESIVCRQARKRKPIEIVKMQPAYNSELGCETVTVYARRIEPEEMLKYMSDGALKFNEMTGDRYKIASIPGYSERLKTIIENESDSEGGSGEELWVDIPGGGQFNRETGEVRDPIT